MDSKPLPPGFKYPHFLLYVPNLIGYFRFISMLVSWFYAFSHPSVFFVCYFISYLLDALDGVMARRLD